uniref:Ig-like domain-containing protein n=1 Tax=Salmo trutta TaxID=8032 RepID=A0A673WE40_SALTR
MIHGKEPPVTLLSLEPPATLLSPEPPLMLLSPGPPAMLLSPEPPAKLLRVEGGSVIVKCYYSDTGNRKWWCRIGVNGSCVERNSATIVTRQQTTDATRGNVLMVTMSGLKMENTGWYRCGVGDLMMTVHITVRRQKLPHKLTYGIWTRRSYLSHNVLYQFSLPWYTSHNTIVVLTSQQSKLQPLNNPLSPQLLSLFILTTQSKDLRGTRRRTPGNYHSFSCISHLLFQMDDNRNMKKGTIFCCSH